MAQFSLAASTLLEDYLQRVAMTNASLFGAWKREKDQSTLLSTCMRHPSAVWSFDFNFGSPDTVVCGRADGHMTVWNVQSALRIDNIIPDPEWMHSTMESNLLAWPDSEKNHSGSVQ
ncbi:hypothetical protein BASA50_010953 [Batrachochytrium salamandrivorans]|uniref:Uncharacterized protein n=1 Tax=Batrachochytrium salamandrivorans TaxID=1357716 RepID=A0ABQ8F055_9FUNG|nr:hypothetical protein BASA50_010953 [Batrachochytrium salamandrivorans]